MNWLEPGTLFAAIMAYIWVIRYTHPWWWVAIPLAMVAAHILRRERPRAIGFRTDNFTYCLEIIGPPATLLVLLLVLGGFLSGTIRTVNFDQRFANWAIYLPWGVVQQYMLNGYFLPRLERASSKRAGPMIAAVLFSLTHLPNWFLMAVTLAGGGCCTHLYRRYPNLYVLGLIHGTVGFFLYLVVPDSISHHLRVGPGWFGRPG